MTILTSAILSSYSVSVGNLNPTEEFNRANAKGAATRIKAIFTGQKHHLLDVDDLTAGKQIRNQHHLGSRCVDIQRIKASEGRCRDFDRDFNPLVKHNKDRWTGIARAWGRGVHLPAVELIKVGESYIVRDGHHRISVAKAMGVDFIDANVTEWVLKE